MSKKLKNRTISKLKKVFSKKVRTPKNGSANSLAGVNEELKEILDLIEKAIDVNKKY